MSAFQSRAWARARAIVARAAGTQTGQQVWRFVRLGAVSAFVIWLSSGHALTWSAGWAALVAGAEVVYRQLRQLGTAGTASPFGAWSPSSGVLNPDEGPGHTGSEPTAPPAA